MKKQRHSQDTVFGSARLLFALGILVCMTLIGYWIMANANSFERIQIVRDGAVVASFEVELMATPEQRTQGLSGRERLPEGRGMLFLFPYAANYAMWMYDMKFSLDFIFFDNDRVAVHIVANEPPCVPGQSCRSIYPGRAVRYVLEVPAGTVAKHGIRLGDQLILPESLPEVF